LEHRLNLGAPSIDAIDLGQRLGAVPFLYLKTCRKSNFSRFVSKAAFRRLRR